MSANSFQEYHQHLICTLAEDIKNSPPFNGDSLDELQVQFLEKLDAIRSPSPTNDTLNTGQWLLAKIVSNYQNIMPLVPRDLFWFFGGDCLHFLGDEEVELFQRIDEVYHDQLEEKKQLIDYGDTVEQVKAQRDARHE